MKKLQSVILPFLLMLTACCHSQQKDIDNISLSYSSARRIPFNTVKIGIHRRDDGKDAFVEVHCAPMEKGTAWKYSEIDTTYDISITQFNSLKQKMALLDQIDPDKAYDDGEDGETCTLAFGYKGRGSSYQYWMPFSSSHKR